MVIPRENSLVRFYVQLNEVKPDESGRADRSKITPEVILKAAQKTLAPYTLEYKHIHWWTGEKTLHLIQNSWMKFADCYILQRTRSVKE